MDNANTLDHLLKIEAEAAALVEDAQAEAERRIHEFEEKNRALFDELFRMEVEMREAFLKKEIEKAKIKYQQLLDDYKNEISRVSADEKHFASLFNEFLAVEG
ncbi:MAG: hypothetical protein FWC03_01650 [Treponema sp.]|nr:hypothetical protein [Treponema sp.]